MRIIKVVFVEHLLHKQALLPHTPHSTHPDPFIFTPFIPFIPPSASLPDESRVSHRDLAFTHATIQRVRPLTGGHLLYVRGSFGMLLISS
jgi:hypothetical protein